MMNSHSQYALGTNGGNRIAIDALRDFIEDCASENRVLRFNRHRLALDGNRRVWLPS
jgi:hypothetical protein